MSNTPARWLADNVTEDEGFDPWRLQPSEIESGDMDLSDPIHDEVCVLCHEKVSFCECWRCDECETLQPISDEVNETNLCPACDACL